LNLKPGDRLYVSHPYGQFLRPTQEKNVGWIATGTGIAPFRSMMRSGYEADKFYMVPDRKNNHISLMNLKPLFGENMFVPLVNY
jgi:predicted ferric reductase